MGYIRKDVALQAIEEDMETSLMCYTDKASKNIVRFCYECVVKEIDRLPQYRVDNVQEERKEKKPLPALDKQKMAGYRHRCPKCGCAVGYVEKRPFRKRILVEKAAKYCCICGQAIDWREHK